MNCASSSENRSTFGSSSVAPIDPASVGLASLITSLCDTFAPASIISKLIKIQMLTHYSHAVKVFLGQLCVCSPPAGGSETRADPRCCQNDHIAFPFRRPQCSGGLSGD